MTAAIIMAIVAAISTAVQIKSANDAAQAQVDAEEKNYAIQENITALKQSEIQKQKVQNITKRQKEALAERARLRVSNSESGIVGVSMGRMFQLSEDYEGSDIKIIESNSEGKLDQTTAELLGVRSRSQSNINQAQSSKTSGSMAGLQIGMSSLGNYTSAGGKF